MLGHVAAARLADAATAAAVRRRHLRRGQPGPARRRDDVARPRRSAVVAGDSKQLPPTTSSTSAATRTRTLTTATGADVESILDALQPRPRTAPGPRYALGWHYRSQDERLIAFSNAHFYDNPLTTFPGTGGVESSCATCRAATARQRRRPRTRRRRRGRPRRGARPRARPAPARRTRWASSRMGIKHAQRIEEALHDRLARPADMRAFFAETATSRSSSRTWNGCRATSATPSSCPSATASADGRLLLPLRPAQHDGRRAAAQRRHHPGPAPDDRRLSFRPTTWTPTARPPEAPRLLAEYLALCRLAAAWTSTAATGGAGAQRRSRSTSATRSPRPGSTSIATVRSRGRPHRLRRPHPDRPAGWCWPSRRTAPSYHSAADRPRPRPPAPGASRAPRLAVPPHLVDGVVRQP